MITSSGRTLTTQERMQLGDGRTDAAHARVVQQFSRAHQVFDMARVARRKPAPWSAP